MQNRAAEQAKIQASSAQQGQSQIDPYPPLFGPVGVGKKEHRDPEPEQQIQRRGQAPEGEAAAEYAKQVITQADPQPQQDTRSKGQGLPRNRDGHGRKSRRKRPPCSCRCS